MNDRYLDHVSLYFSTHLNRQERILGQVGLTLRYIPDDWRIRHINYKFSGLGIFEIAKPLVSIGEVQIVCGE